MLDDSRKKRVLKTARALICRDGTAFTVAGLCEECGLSRSQFRRLFSTRAKLLEILAREVTEKARSGVTASQAQETRDIWLERRFRVLERAINSLEARLDAGALQDQAAEPPSKVQDSVEVAQPFTFKPDMPETIAGAAPASEPENAMAGVAIAITQAAPDVETGASPDGMDDPQTAARIRSRTGLAPRH